MKKGSIISFLIALGIIISIFVYANTNQPGPFVNQEISSDKTADENPILWPNDDFSILMDGLNSPEELTDVTERQLVLEMLEKNTHFELLKDYMLEHYPERIDGDYEYKKLKLGDTPYYSFSTGFPPLYERPDESKYATLLGLIPVDASSGKNPLIYIEENLHSSIKSIDEYLDSGGPDILYVDGGNIERFNMVQANMK